MDEHCSALELAGHAGCILLKNGAEIFRVQETMTRILDAYGVTDHNVYVISNGIFASVDEQGEVHSTEIRHIPLSPVHFGRVAAVNELSRKIAAGSCGMEEAFARLEEIRAIPYTKAWFQVLAAGVGSACFCYIFGGGAADSLASFFCGLAVYLFVLFAGGKRLSKIITNLAASALAALCGLALFKAGLGPNLDKIIIGSIIPLVPGVPLTTAIRDFLNSDYLSGTIRLIDAVLVAACIAIGVGFVLKVFQPVLGVVL